MPENKLPMTGQIKTFGTSRTSRQKYHRCARYHRVDRLNAHFVRINMNIIRISQSFYHPSVIRIIVSSLLYNAEAALHLTKLRIPRLQ